MILAFAQRLIGTRAHAALILATLALPGVVTTIATAQADAPQGLLGALSAHPLLFTLVLLLLHSTLILTLHPPREHSPRSYFATLLTVFQHRHPSVPSASTTPERPAP